MNPAFIHTQLAESLADMQLVADAYRGGAHVNKYLPNPSPSYEIEEIKRARYDAYVMRANYYNVTRKTAKALHGMVFSKYPIVDIDEGIDKSELITVARKAVMQTLLKGRCGLLADYPLTQGLTTVAELKANGHKPKIKLYEAESIINWRVENDKLVLVVLKENIVKEDDGFAFKYTERLHVLRLINGIASSQFFTNNDGQWIAGEVVAFRQKDGSPFTELPFTFIGAENNDSDIDDSPLLDLAKLNLSHYRNSADYEEAVFIAGQPTLFITGVTDAWQAHYDENPIELGVRTAHLLGTGSTAEMLQVQPNLLLADAMDRKEKQMVALGAKLIEPSAAAKTATQANSDTAESTSILSTLANNVSDAIVKVANFCALYIGGRDDNVFSLNTNFMSNKMSPEERRQLIAEWQAGAISFDEMRARLFEDEIATIEDPNEAKEIIDAQLSSLNL